MSPANEPKENVLPKHKGGGGWLIGLGVLLLFAAGGLVVWKSQSQKGDELVEEAVGLPSSQPADTELAEPPPPPPPIDTAPTPSAAATAAAPTSGNKAGPCSGDCKGTEGAGFEAALRARAGQARTCYNRGLRANAELEGKMTVSLRVSPAGTACSAAIVNDTVGDPATASCVLDKFRSGTYPAPTGGCVGASVPLNFVTK